MKQGAVRILQEVLQERGLYPGPVDSSLNVALSTSVNDLIEERTAELTESPEDWNDKRKRVAAFQIVCKDAGFDPGPLDGLWGQLTEYAYFEIGYFRDTGVRPLKYRDIVPLNVNPNGWPVDRPNQQELFDFFDFNPNHGGEPALSYVQCPWRLTLTFNPSQSTQRIGCHPKVAESLERVLTNIHDHYGTDALTEIGLDMYGGCKNVRLKTGSASSWSTHAFAAALDWDDKNNKYEWSHRRARLAQPDCLEFWRFWEEEGWLSLGRERDFDWMHVQAIKLP